MLILLPPSEGKSEPRRGKPLDLASLSSQGLTATRRSLLEALTDLCRDDPLKAADVLGLGPTQADAVARNAMLTDAPTARADRVYSGVLYSALDLPTLDASARRRATRALAIGSGLFGVVRPDDRIPAYRLSGNVTLPGLGTVAGLWREVLGPVLTEMAGSGLVIDLRSAAYTGFGRPTSRTVSVRVLHEHDGVRKVVSHFNKATKGRLARDLLSSGVSPRTSGKLVDALRDLGWTVEADGHHLDVVVSEV